MVSCQKGPTRHAYAWQIGPFWQETLDKTFTSKTTYFPGDVGMICECKHSASYQSKATHNQDSVVVFK